MKLTAGVNFINILCSTFALIFFAPKKLQSQIVKREKLRDVDEIDYW